jgi:hypothetical protein
LSENGVRTALRTLGYDNDTMTPHGFRAMARTLLDEVLDYRVDWIEHQLAHAVKDPNGRAYNRTAHLEGRGKMMTEWADYLDSLRLASGTKQAAVKPSHPVHQSRLMRRNPYHTVLFFSHIYFCFSGRFLRKVFADK